MEIIVSQEALNGIVNFDELKTFAREQIAPYENLMVEEEELSTAKTVVANLRRLSKAADQERIRIQKEHDAKIELTKQQLKDLSGIFNNAALRIDAQVKEIVNERKQQKRLEIRKHFLDNSTLIAEYLSFEDIEDPKWLNASVSLDSVKAQVDEYIERFTADVKAVESIDCDAATMVALKGCFKRTHSVSEVLQMKNRIDAEKARREAEKSAQEAAHASQKTEEKPDVLTEMPKPSFAMPSNITERDVPAAEKAPAPQLQTESGKVTHTFWVTGTREQFVLLRQFLTANGMAYGRP